MDRRAIACFDQALADGGLADDSALRQVLHDYFAWAMSSFTPFPQWAQTSRGRIKAITILTNKLHKVRNVTVAYSAEERSLGG